MFDGIRLRIVKSKSGDPRVDALPPLELPPEPKLTSEEEVLLSMRPAIKMDRALLCLDCESIFEAEGAQRCPSCGSEVAWSLGRALNRLPHADAHAHAQDPTDPRD